MHHPFVLSRRSTSLQVKTLSLLVTGLLLVGCTPDAAPSPVTSAPATPVESAPVPVPTPAVMPILTPQQLIFSGVQAATTAPRTFSLQNTGTQSMEVTALTLSGPDAAAFVLNPPPTLPLTIEAGKSFVLSLRFSPPKDRVGSLNAALQVTVKDGPAVNLSLAGLSTKGLEGEFEPPLAQIVRTLGYSTDVCGRQANPDCDTVLLLGTSAPLLGEEVVAPMFRKTGSGPVTLTPVARYSPADVLSYGFFTLQGGQPVQHPVGVVAKDQYQTLNPTFTPSTPSYDPAGDSFGIYTGPNGYSPTSDYTLDRLNTGPTAHAMRVYPLHSGSSTAVSGYLIGVEASSNGDYQDAVFILTGAEPAPATP